MQNDTGSGTRPASTCCSGHAWLHFFLPRTLFGQLVLTFSTGFLALLFLGAVHASQTHQYFLLRGLMSDRARMLAHLTLLLDTADSGARASLIERLSVRGVSIHITPDAPVLPVPSPDQKNLRDASKLLALLLQRALDDTRDLGPADHFHNEKNAGNTPEPLAVLNNEPAKARITLASVQAINIPSMLDDMRASLWRSGEQRVPPKGPEVYRAEVGVPLSDGTWVVYEDSAPGFRGMPDFPLKNILLTELFFVLICMLAFYLTVRPLRRLARAADNFGRDLPGTPPLPETGPREVREAAQAFNRMQCRIREFVDERARTVAAVSHDLRTPLTRMRLRVEQLEERVRAPLQKDMDELQQLMDTTIDLARGSGSEGYAPVDVAALLESLVEDRQDMGQNVTLRNAGALRQVKPLLARPLSVKRCLGNLLDNAVRYGGNADVDVEDGPFQLVILIRDHGPGIRKEDLARVFEPFYRLEPSRNRGTGGNGLGLSIARSMVRLHGGDITLDNEPGGGLCARVVFPRRVSDKKIKLVK